MEARLQETLVSLRDFVRVVMMMMMKFPIMIVVQEQKQLMRITEETDSLLDKEKCQKDTEQLLQQTRRKLILFSFISLFYLIRKETRTRETNMLRLFCRKKGNDVVFYCYDYHNTCKSQAPKKLVRMETRGRLQNGVLFAFTL